MAPILLPDDVPVATADRRCLTRFGTVFDIKGIDPKNACVLVENSDGTRSVWCAREYSGYRSACEKAAEQKLVDSFAEWGACIDADHVAARTVSSALKLNGWFLRIHPVFAEVNRSAGASREKIAARSRTKAKELLGRRTGDVIFANELQILKMIGHPVGTAANPEIIFD
jgi:hypothetical protein